MHTCTTAVRTVNAVGSLKTNFLGYIFIRDNVNRKQGNSTHQPTNDLVTTKMYHTENTHIAYCISYTECCTTLHKKK